MRLFSPMFQEFIPKLYVYLRSGYSLLAFKRDCFAGITVGIIALPLAMAFAIASGLTPEHGLVTAIVAGFLISALGGSRVQIGGPTGAFVVIVYGIMQRTGYEGLAISTLIAAALLIFFGIFRLGTWIKFIPYPLITGFTAGIALIIFTSQVKDFFGLNIEGLPTGFLGKWSSYIAALPSFDPSTLFLGGATLLLIILLRHFVPSLPWGVIAIIAATLCASFFKLPVATIYSQFGSIPNHLPTPHFPSFNLPQGQLMEVFIDGVAIALLGGIESLLSAVIGDGLIGGRHKSNCELVAQGIANCGAIFFGGMPATGAIARTVVNVKSGAQTPLAGIIHAITLGIILYFFAPLVGLIPLAALAAVLMMVAWNMSEVRTFISLLKAPAGDIAVLLTAFFLTVFVDITVAISLGMVLASLLFMKRMSQVSKTVQLTTLFQEQRNEFPEKERASLEGKKIPPHVEIYEIQGPFFFGAADMLKDLLVGIELKPKVFILRLRHVHFIDASGMNALKEFYHKCHREDILLFLSEVSGPLEKDLKRGDLLKAIGKDHIFATFDQALDFSRWIVEVERSKS